MQDLIRINSHFAVAALPLDRTDIQQAAQNGFGSIVNLRTTAEKQELAPDAEGRIAKNQGLAYLHHPVSGDDLSEDAVERFRQKINSLPGPILVHCATGRRSGALVMMHLAIEQGLSGEQAVEKAAYLGFECDTPELEAFVKHYVNGHTSAAAA
ncbi:hypothetical protein BAL199_03064 [alpha proteobacterium BAL199]|nr:hypothetical protein BAL199_03064 [alpha proteobacterium BAL199]